MEGGGGGVKRSILRPQPISLGAVQWTPGVLFGESFFPTVLEAPLGIPHIDAPGSAGIFWRGVCVRGEPRGLILRMAFLGKSVSAPDTLPDVALIWRLGDAALLFIQRVT